MKDENDVQHLSTIVVVRMVWSNVSVVPFSVRAYEYLERFQASTASSNIGLTLRAPSKASFQHVGHDGFSRSCCLTHCSPLLQWFSIRMSIRIRTKEQKVWPHGNITGASYSSLHILHLSAASSPRRPGESFSAGKSVGSCISASSKSASPLLTMGER